MKKSLFLVSMVLAIVFFSSNGSALEQTNETCYSYCAAYELYWSGDFVWKYIMEYCTMSEEDAAKVIYKLIKTASKGSTESLEVVAQALVCAGWINYHIAPILDDCKDACNANIYAYAPDPTTRGYSSIVYSKNNNKLLLNIWNHGVGYATNITVDVYAGSTSDRDCEITNWEMIGSYVIDELSPYGVLRNDLQIPHNDHHEIPWAYEEDMCNKIKVIIDPDNTVPELGEEDGVDWDNEYIVDIYDLPTLPGYMVEGFEYEMFAGILDSIRIWFDVKNTGEMDGSPSVHVKKCGESGSVAWEDSVSIEGGEKRSMEFDLLDLTDSEDTQDVICLDILIEDEFGTYTKREQVAVYSGSVQGTVYDMYGETVGDATVTMGGYSAETDSKGEYEIRGINELREYTLTATSPSHDFDGTARVNIAFEDNSLYPIGLSHYKVDIVLMDSPGSAIISCPYGGYIFEMDSGYYNYRGGVADTNTYLPGIVPGEYTIRFTKDGFGSSIQSLIIQPGEEKTIDCGLEPSSVYQDDSGILFSPMMNPLWTIPLARDGTENPYYAEISKDGSTVVMLLANPRAGEAKTLIYSKEGQKLGEFLFTYGGGQLNAKASMSYDGSKILIGNKYLLSRTGQLLSENPEGKESSNAYISHDGSMYCYVSRLYDQQFREVTGDLIGSDEDYVRCPSASWGGSSISFTPDNTIVGKCKKAGICRVSMGEETQISEETADSFDQNWDGSVFVASSFDTSSGSAILRFFENDGLVLEKEIECLDRYSGFGDLHFARLSVSPGEGYIAALNGPHGFDYGLFVFDSQGNDLLNIQSQDVWRWNAMFAARATGTGIYYLSHGSEGLTFGVLGQPGTAEKQEVEAGDMVLPEWEMGASSGLETAAAIIITSTISFALLYHAWKVGML